MKVTERRFTTIGWRPIVRTVGPKRLHDLVAPPAYVELGVPRHPIPSPRAKWPIKQRAPESLPVQTDRESEERRQRLVDVYRTLQGFIERSRNKWLKLPLLVRSNEERHTFGAPLEVYQVMSFLEKGRNRILFGVNVRYGEWQRLKPGKLRSPEVQGRTVTNSDVALDRVTKLIFDELRSRYPLLEFQDATSQFESYRVHRSGDRRRRLTPYHGFVIVIAVPLGQFELPK